MTITTRPRLLSGLLEQWKDRTVEKVAAQIADELKEDYKSQKPPSVEKVLDMCICDLMQSRLHDDEVGMGRCMDAVADELAKLSTRVRGT